MNKSNAVIEKLVESEKIPSIGEFDVTAALIDEYQKIYKSLYERIGAELKTSNKNYARKLAGIFLMKENQTRVSSIVTAKLTKSKYKTDCGIVYVISNPSFVGCYKVGMTKDLDRRLKSYQTYDPNRAFKVDHYRFVKNAKEVEQRVLSTFSFDLMKGEWIKSEEIKDHFIETIKNM